MGYSRKDSANDVTKAPARPSNLRMALWTAAGIAVAIAAWLVYARFSRPVEKPLEPQARGQPARAKRNAPQPHATRPPAETRAVVNGKKAVEGEGRSKVAEWKPNSNMRPPNVPEGEAWMPGRPKIHDVEYVVANAGVNPPYRNALEQNLVNIFTCELGDAPRPLGPTDYRDRKALTEILISPNPVTDEDSENVKVAKETLALAKKEMAKYIGDGGDPEFFLQHYRNMLLSAWKKRQDALEMAREMQEKDVDEERVKAYVRRINEVLAAEGIKRISL